MKTLPFIKELIEARMFFAAKDVKGMTANEIAEIIYLIFMMLEVMRSQSKSAAADYANKTLQFADYDNMFYSATDLANLLAVLNHQDTFKSEIKTKSSVSIPIFQLNRYLRSVASGASYGSDDTRFFWQLEDYLNLYSNSTFRQLRRDISVWNKLQKSDRAQFVNIIRKEFDRRASQADVYLWFKQNYRLNESIQEASDVNSVPTLAYHETLNPALWDGFELRPDVKEALGKIANKFSEYVDIKQLKIVDYIITGSNCAFNYTNQSDIDLHVIVDAAGLGNDNPLLDPFLLAKKSLWNSEHDITIKGYTVELYAEDANKDENTLVAAGQYSLLHDKWIVKPTHEQISINDRAVQAKAEDIIHWISTIVTNGAEPSEMDEVRKKIKKLRQAGLDKGGEFSCENLAFKVIRNSGIFDKMNDYEKHKEDNDLSLESIEEEKESEPMDIECQGDWDSRVFFKTNLPKDKRNWLEMPRDKIDRGEATVDLISGEGMAYISRIEAKPTGQGFGSELLKYIEEQCKEHDYNRITAYVEYLSVQSKDMFRNAGYKIAEERKHGDLWEKVL